MTGKSKALLPLKQHNPFLESIGKPTVTCWPPCPRTRPIYNLSRSRRGRGKRAPSQLARQVRRCGVESLTGARSRRA